jgi:fructose-1,6-bisphosphatase class II
MKNFHLDLVRVTEAGAISAAEWVGRGDKEAADKAATDAMRNRLNRIGFCATIAIGEGIKDDSYGLFVGEQVGKKWTDGSIRHDDHFVEIAVDPIEGTTPTAKGGYEAMSVIALGNKGAFFKTENFYMNKLAIGPKAHRKFGHVIDIKRDIEYNIPLVAAALDKQVNHITVCLLDRPRHDELVARLRKLGCRIKLISDCDVTACIATCVEDSGVDVYIGVGGAPEAVIAAAAMKCMKGKFQAQITDKNGEPIDERILGMEDLAKGPVMFAATGITDGKLLKGVQFTSHGPVTHSIAMRSESGTIRRIVTEHGN